MQARYYDPVIGRFYSNDPIGFRDVHSFNRYAYANNNPYKYTDPDGKEPSLLNMFSESNLYANMFGFSSAAQGNQAVDNALSVASKSISDMKKDLNSASAAVAAVASIGTVVCTAFCQPAVPVLGEIAISATLTTISTSDNPGKEIGKELVTLGLGRKIDAASAIVKATSKVSAKVVDTITEAMKYEVGNMIDENMEEKQ